MKRSRMLLWLVLAALAALLAGCGGGGGGGAITTAVIQGLVSDSNGVPLPGVAVTVGTATTNSGADGTYTLTVAPGANLKVAASKAGLANTFKVVSLAVGQTMPVNFTLIAVGKSNALTNLDTANSFADSARGASVTLPASSLVIEGTNTVVTNATVDVTNAVPTDTNYTENFPGLFVGTQNGADVAIESFGYMTIDVTSGGQKCNLGAGKTADIAIPVAAGADPGTPTIPLWSLDEATGKWVHEGDATRDATVNPVVYRATVTHFSSYNLDRAIENAIPFTITVKNSAGQNVAGASVVITSTNNTGGGKWESRGVTGANGTIRFPSVAPGQVAVNVVYGNQTGSGYGYDVDNGEATMTVTLKTTVKKTFTLVYNDNGTEKPAANINFQVVGEGGPGTGHDFANGTTDANGVVTLNLTEGQPFYMYWASITVGGVTYTADGQANSIAALPSKIVMNVPPAP